MNNTIKYNQSGEDYLESIFILSSQLPVVHRVDISKRLSVSSAAVNKAVNILLEGGFVYEEGKHLYLTEKGTTYAEKIYQKHCLLRSFLRKLGVSEENAELDACKLEHLLSDESFSAIKNFTEEEK